VKTIDRPGATSPAAMPEALIREARQRQRKRYWLIAATVVAVIAVVAAIAGIGGGRPVRRSGSHGHPAPGGSATQTLRVDWRVRVSAGVASLTLADGSLWAAGFGAVTRLDPLSGRTIARISTPRTLQVPAVTSFDGRIWVSSGGFGDSTGTLYEIDPAIDKVVRVVRIPGQPSNMTGGGGYLWVDVQEQHGDVLQPFNPRTGRLLPVVVTSFQGVNQPAYGLGSVWVSVDGTRVWQVDPKTMRAKLFWPPPSAPGWFSQPGSITISGDSVWIISGYQIGRFDPATGVLEHTASITKTEGVALQAAGASLWMLMQTGSSSPDVYNPDPRQPGRVGRINPDTGAFEGAPVTIGSSGAYDSFAASGTMAWVGDRQSSTVIAIGPGPAT
jgi:hypothetical protein